MQYWGKNLLLGVGVVLLGAEITALADDRPDPTPEMPSATDVVDGTELEIEPKRCILKSGQADCRTHIAISWQSALPRNYCLYEKGEDLILACWEDAIRGGSKYLFVGNESTHYVLKTADDQVVSTATFTVSRVLRSRRKTSKRKRRLWGFP